MLPSAFLTKKIKAPADNFEDSIKLLARLVLM